MPKGLYKISYRPRQAPDKSKPWCIYNVNTDDINGRWHSSRADALDQLKAMYASMGNKAVKMNTEQEISYLFNLKTFAEGGLKWLEGNQLWVQQYPFDSWSHPVFGETTIDRDRALKLKESFDKGVRGQKIFTDYEHGLDAAKGNKASGEVKELKVIDEARGIFTKPGLWARVQFSDAARKEIDAGEWNYWSTSHYDTWTHPQTGETHELVYDGGGVTNKPYVKGMVPINFSELGVDEATATAAAEETPETVEPIVEDDGFPIKNSGNGDIVIDNDDEGGDKVKLEEFQAQLREKLGLPADADIITAVEGINTELAPIREALKTHAEKKKFSELFPGEYERMQKLEKHEADRQARQFSESFANTRLTKKVGEKDEDTTQGFSALVLEQIEGLAKKFSEGNAELTDVKTLLDAVAKNGIVDYGTKGSSREDENREFNEDAVQPGDMLSVRKQFAEKARQIAEEDKIPFDKALVIAGDKFPNLAEAYHASGMTR